MGVIWRAYTIIGQRIDPEDLLTQETVKDDPHEKCGDNRGNGKFCSYCGELRLSEPTIRINKILREGVMQSYRGSWEDAEVNGVPIEIVGWGDEDVCFVAAEVSIAKEGYNSCISKMNYDNIDEHRALVKKALEPLGLWNPDAFGIWTILFYIENTLCY